jgi:hypothetical protein
MRLLAVEALQLAADLAVADMPAAALAAVTWVAAAAMAAAVTGKLIFGASPKSPSASADGPFL